MVLESFQNKTNLEVYSLMFGIILIYFFCRLILEGFEIIK